MTEEFLKWILCAAGGIVFLYFLLVYVSLLVKMCAVSLMHGLMEGIATFENPNNVKEVDNGEE